MTIDRLRSLISAAVAKVSRNYVVVAPLVLAFLSSVPGDTAVTDYKVWGPVLLGVIARQFFTSPTKEKDAAVLRAFKVGRSIGLSRSHLADLEHPADQKP